MDSCKSICQTLTIQVVLAALLVSLVVRAIPALADGKVIAPRNYEGSLEEKSQEAIVIVQPAAGLAVQDMILKIMVTGRADRFAWVIPFPTEPEVFAEDPKLFAELFNYVELRRAGRPKPAGRKNAEAEAADASPAVEVLSRNTVGSYQVAVVRETQAGGLNPWLVENDFQPLEDADDVIGFYRDKGFVFACLRFSSEALAAEQTVDTHPLRFRFSTGGQDAVYFPMKMTGLQNDSFAVTLYVFYPAWINDQINQFGFAHRGFHLEHRDWDTPDCEPNGGKTYSAPQTDPYLRGLAQRLPTVAELFQRLYPGGKFYLTKISATGLQPQNVRHWSDDLWLFPYYTDRGFIPLDARKDGVAAAAWPQIEAGQTHLTSAPPNGAPPAGAVSVGRIGAITLVAGTLLLLLVAFPLFLRRWISARAVVRK